MQTSGWGYPEPQVSGKRQCAALSVMIMMGDMSTEDLSRTNAQTDDHPPAARAPLLRRPWVAPLALLTVIFIAYAVPPYLSLDPAQARIQPMPSHSSYYPLLVTHILLGSAALLAACFRSGRGFARLIAPFIGGAVESMSLRRCPPQSVS